jgi:short-subunit dehydrogenase
MHLLVLGGNSDIGLAISRKFVEQENAEITLASRNREELEKNASDLSIRHNTEVHTAYFDACDLSSHERFYKNLETPPDGVILAFGYNGDQQLAEKSGEELQKIIETNYLGAASILRIIANDFEQRADENSGTPFIIGISSVAGERGRKKNYIYGSAKAGFTALLSGLRQRLSSKGVSVITVKPGFVDTKMTSDMDLPNLLLLTPEKVAEKTYKAYKKKKNTSYITWYWWSIITVIKSIPERIFKRLDL